MTAVSWQAQHLTIHRDTYTQHVSRTYPVVGLGYLRAQVMVILVTGRRILMLHGNEAGVNANVATTRRHTYGVVEWEAEFDLVALVEVEEGAGHEGGESVTGG